MRKHIRFAALLLLAALILWWFGRGLDWTHVFAAIEGANWAYLALAGAIIAFSYLLRAFRWRALLRPLCAADLTALFAATTVGFGALFLLGRAGEVFRPAFLPLRDRRVGPGAAFVTIGVERIYDLVAVVLLFSGNLLWFRPPTSDPTFYPKVRIVGLFLLGGCGLGIIALVLFQRYAPLVIAWLDRRFVARTTSSLLRRAGTLLLGLLKQLRSALGVLVDARSLAVTVGWTIVLWGSVVVANWAILQAFDLKLGYGATIFLMGWALVGSLVPTPGGAAGAFHAVTAAGLIFLGVARDRAAAVAIIMHLTVFAPAVIFGLYYFTRSKVTLAQLRQLVSMGETKASEGESAPPNFSASNALKS